MGGAASIKRDFPATRKDQSRGPAPLFFCRPHSPLPVKGEFPSGLSQQNQAGLPVPGSWRQQQMANRQSKLIKLPNVLRFGFQIREAALRGHCAVCIIFIWRHCPALAFPSLALARDDVHCISISASQKIQGSSEARKPSMSAIYAQRLSMGPISVFYCSPKDKGWSSVFLKYRFRPVSWASYSTPFGDSCPCIWRSQSDF